MHCVVKGCHNSSNKNLKHITFHSFPSDPIAADLWIKRIRLNRKEDCWKPSKYSKICSEHFDDTEKYTTKGGSCKIHIGVVPTKGLHMYCSDETDKDNCINHDIKPEEPELSQVSTCQDETNENINVATPTTSSLPNQQLINCKQTLECRDIVSPVDPDLDYVFDTPLQYALRKQLFKMKLLQRKHVKKIKLLQQKTRRLEKKNLALKKILIDLKKHQRGGSLGKSSNVTVIKVEEVTC